MYYRGDGFLVSPTTKKDTRLNPLIAPSIIRNFCANRSSSNLLFPRWLSKFFFMNLNDALERGRARNGRFSEDSEH